jgi:glycosyl transferase family 25
MRTQLDALGLPYTIVDGVHGARTPDHYLFSKYNDKKRVQRRGAGSSLRLSQLGCFASHYLLWERCANDGQPIIVLEDDAIVLPPFLQFYQNVDQFAQSYGLVWLQPSRKQAQHAGKTVQTVGPFTIRKYAKGFSGTTGYLLTPDAARTLLSYSREWIYPVDNTMDRFFEHGVEAIGLYPVCVQQDDDFESAINVADTNERRSLADRVRREAYSLQDALARSWHNLKFAIKARVRGGA